MPIKKESDLDRILKRSLEDATGLEKVHGTNYTGGKADLLGCYKGLMIHIESKVNPRHTTPQQALNLQKWFWLGAYCGVCCYIPSTDTIWMFEIDFPFEIIEPEHHRKENIYVPCKDKTAIQELKYYNDIENYPVVDFYPYKLEWKDGRKGKVITDIFFSRLANHERLKNERSRKQGE